MFLNKSSKQLGLVEKLHLYSLFLQKPYKSALLGEVLVAKWPTIFLGAFAMAKMPDCN